MKKVNLMLLLFIFSNSYAQKEKADSSFTKLIKILGSLKYEPAESKVKLNTLGSIKVPKGFKYLNGPQSKQVLEDIWGNPPNEEPLGMLFRENGSPVDSLNGWAFVIRWDDLGYVKDDEADDIDYAELLDKMKEETAASSEERGKLGYGTLSLVGWASDPFYDKTRKTLHWAKNIKFDGETENTLNYDVRILGRNGVFSMNAIGTLNELKVIKPTINDIIASIEFSEGNKYSDFNPSMDKVAAVGIGGLVAGKVLAKAGFFVLIAKFWKIIIGVIAVAFGGIGKLFGGKKNDEEA